MTQPDILVTVIRRITQTTPAPLRWKIGPNASLKDDLCLDAVDRLTIACAIDEDLQIAIPDADLTAWENVADVTASAMRLADTTRRVAQPNYERLGLGSAWEAEGRN